MKNGLLNRAAQSNLKTAHREDPDKDLEFLTIDEACELSKLSRWSIYRLLRKTDADGNYLIRWSKLGSSRNSPVRIDKASFMAFLETKVQYAHKEGGEEK